ncbi:MAG: hypothetical protein ACK2T7_05545 [Anaerolineales bacterium]
MRTKWIGVWLGLILIQMLSGCGAEFALFATETPTPTITPSPTLTFTPPPTPTAPAPPPPTFTPTPTLTPTITPTPTITNTPTITPSPTFDFPDVTVNTDAHCRFGPNVNYLHAIDLWVGDTGEVHNRNHDGSWLYIWVDKWGKRCWVSASVVDVEGDIFSVYEWMSPLPWTTFSGPVKGLTATRQGDQVTLKWKALKVPEDDKRGYMIEATICTNGVLIDVVYHTMKTSYTFTDEQTCDSPSHGLLYGVEKHGYTKPVEIPWP